MFRFLKIPQEPSEAQVARWETMSVVDPFDCTRELECMSEIDLDDNDDNLEAMSEIGSAMFAPTILTRLNDRAGHLYNGGDNNGNGSRESSVTSAVAKAQKTEPAQLPSIDIAAAANCKAARPQCQNGELSLPRVGGQTDYCSRAKARAIDNWLNTDSHHYHSPSSRAQMPVYSGELLVGVFQFPFSTPSLPEEWLTDVFFQYRHLDSPKSKRWSSSTQRISSPHPKNRLTGMS